MPQGKLLLVDGHAFAYRAFFAIQRLSNSKGEPTNAVYGFAKMLRKMLQEFKPTHAAVVMDKGEPTKRIEKLKTYKAQRKPMPEDLYSQMPQICEFVQASRIPLLEREGEEADDIIATLAVLGRNQGMEVSIATSDKDFMQLVGDRITLLNPAAKETSVINAAAVENRYGVNPGQIVDFLSLQGDSVDNIPGVPGIGEKTAAALLQQFGSLDELYRRLDQMTDGKLREKLREHQPRVQLNRELVKLDTGVDLGVTLDQLVLARPDFPALISLCQRLEFRGLTEEIRRESALDSNPELSLGI
jgi:DNA polymerase-1